MKKLIISAALLAATSSGAFAQTVPSFSATILAPVASTITATQTGVAMPINNNSYVTTGSTGTGGGNTTSGWDSRVTQSAGVMNVISSSLASGIVHY